MSRLIGLSGYAQSGKDTAAGILSPEGFSRVAFADALKELALAVNPIVVPELGTRLKQLVEADGWEHAKRRAEVRRLLQNLGREVRNIIGEDTWINVAMARVFPGFDFVITDVRYPNEANRIKAEGGLIWRIERDGVGPVNEDSSETAMDSYGFDAVIRNDSDLETFTFNILAELANG